MVMEGVTLMLVGMSTVFGFLTLLVLTIAASGMLLKNVEFGGDGAVTSGESLTAGSEGERVAVALAAIARLRGKG